MTVSTNLPFWLFFLSFVADFTNKLALKQENFEEFAAILNDSSDIGLTVKREDSSVMQALSNSSSDEQSIPQKCSMQTNDIHSQADLRKLFDCRVIAGDLVISEYQDSSVQLGGIETIGGSLIIEDEPGINKLEATNLKQIKESFKLQKLTSFSHMSVPKLQSVKQVDWVVLPMLSNVYLENEIDDVEKITLADTSLSGFTGFSIDKLDHLDINNNRDLEIIHSNVTQITGNLHIAANSKNVRVALPHLESVRNISIHEISDLYASNIKEVKDTVNIINNDFETLSLKNLKDIGGTLNLYGNKALREVDFSALMKINGGLIISKNDKIEKIDFFPLLLLIDGAIEIDGNVKEANFEKLRLVKGSALTKTTNAGFDCDEWIDGRFSRVVRGDKIECNNGRQSKTNVIKSTTGKSLNHKANVKNSSALQLFPRLNHFVRILTYFSLALVI